MNRFYRARDKDNMPQNEYFFETFVQSINARIKANSAITLIFTFLQIFFYITVVDEFQRQQGLVDYFKEWKAILAPLGEGSPAYIAAMKPHMDLTYEGCTDVMDLATYLRIVQIFCMLTMTYFVQDVVSIVLLTGLGRYWSLRLIYVTDFAMFVLSLMTISTI